MGATCFPEIILGAGLKGLTVIRYVIACIYNDVRVDHFIHLIVILSRPTVNALCGPLFVNYNIINNFQVLKFHF